MRHGSISLILKEGRASRASLGRGDCEQLHSLPAAAFATSTFLGFVDLNLFWSFSLSFSMDTRSASK